MSSAQSAMSSTEASDMQAAADSYVQVILSGEAPYQIVWASEAWLKLVGYPNDEACGKTLKLVEGPLTSQASVDVLMSAIRGGRALKTPMIHHARSGRAFSHEMRVEPLKDSLGLVQRAGRRPGQGRGQGRGRASAGATTQRAGQGPGRAARDRRDARVAWR